MKFIRIITLALSLFLALNEANAQSGRSGNFGFGLMGGEPSGITIKYYTSGENAFDAYIGSSYFGKLRVGGDYLWHFNAFNSNIVKMYAGVGATFGFGRGDGFFYKNNNKDRFYYWEDNSSTGIAARALLGINIMPRNTPLEIFFEVGPLIGIAPNFGSNFEGALGIRFYP